MGVVKWKDNQCSYQDSIMIYKRPEVVSISPYMQHEVFQITETHPDLFIRLLKAPATSIAMFKITICSGALTVGEHSHISSLHQHGTQAKGPPFPCRLC